MVSNIVSKYMKLIDDLQIELRSNPKYRSHREQCIKNVFKEICKKKVSILNDRLVITKDNDFALAIRQHLQQIQLNFHNDFKRKEEKISYIVSLNRICSQEDFISLREFKKNVQKSIQIRKNPEFRLNVELDTLIKQQSQYEFRQTLFNEIRGEDVNAQDDNIIKKCYDRFYREALKNYNRKLVIKIDEIISKFENKEEILTPQIIQQLQKYLGQDIGRNDEEIQLNKLLMMKAESQSINSNEIYLKQMNQQYQYLKNILDKFSSMKLIQNQLKIKLHVAKFGSNVSGFASRNTDMDITIITDCYISQVKFLRYLHQFLQAQFRQKDKNSYKLDFIGDARVPLIKLRLNNKDIQFHFDIIVNNILGVINSKFLGVYGQINWIKYVIILVKQWGKAQGLVSQNLFSSYGLTLMVLNFLIVTKRINLIMDSRTRSQDAPHFIYKRNVKNSFEEFKVYYKYKTHKNDVTSLKRVNLYEILLQFFEYYLDDQVHQQRGKHWELSTNQQIISVDGGICEYDPSFIFTIKDPFDQKHNPGRVKEGEKNKVMIKFKKAIEVLRGKINREVQNLFGNY